MEGRQVLYLCYWRRFFNLWTGVWDSRCRVDWAAPVYCALPPYPPPPLPSSPPLPPPLATCGDLAGRQQLRGRPAEHCWQLPSGSAACEQYYSNTSAGIALCMAPAEREAAVCGQSGFILDCTSPPPSPPPGRPISALEAAIGIDTALASAHQRRIFAASALAAFLVLLFMAVSCAFFVSQTAAAAPPPPPPPLPRATARAVARSCPRHHRRASLPPRPPPATPPPPPRSPSAAAPRVCGTRTAHRRCACAWRGASRAARGASAAGSPRPTCSLGSRTARPCASSRTRSAPAQTAGARARRRWAASSSASRRGSARRTRATKDAEEEVEVAAAHAPLMHVV
mmetsp:Transcript_2608/g.8766  ORF Transcript_2608/g.8766 Transcript_2608/m.8766 type:complete len:341 (-) Transcript_2608:812-1834(-)